MKAVRDQVRLSKFLSYILRHSPEAAGLALDKEGWAEVEALIEGAARAGRTLDKDMIREIVAGSDKKRFTLSPDGERIRAAQGHSTAGVDIDFASVRPPDLLYHGTARTRREAILASGLEPRGRHYVHLSPDERTATAVGRRHGEPVVLLIASGRMYDAGLHFHRADNGVWLTRFVPADYISF